LRRRFKKSKLKKRVLPMICYVCGKEVFPDTKFKRVMGKDGKTILKTMTIQPLMIGKDKKGRPLYRHLDGKCEPGSAYYLKKVNEIDPQFKRLFENGLVEHERKVIEKEKRKAVPNIDENIQDADWPKQHKKLRRRK